MIRHSVPEGRIYTAADMLADPHIKAREALVEVDSPRWGPFSVQNSFPKFSETPGGVRRLAPAEIGEDNAAVYKDLLGIDDAELSRMQSAGTI